MTSKPSAGTKVQTYHIYTSPDEEIPMINVIREMGIEGIMWPNREEPRFDLEISEEVLLILKLKVPIRRYILA